MREVVQVQLRTAGEIRYFFTGGMKFDAGSKVIVEADRGLEYGEIVSLIEKVTDISFGGKPLRKIINRKYCSEGPFSANPESISNPNGFGDPDERLVSANCGLLYLASS